MMDDLQKKLNGFLKKSVGAARRQMAKPDDGRVDWQAIIKTQPALWREALAKAKHGPPVLIGTSLGSGRWDTLDSELAVALTLRGANVHVVLCDEALPACAPWTWRKYERDPQGPPGEMCADCYPVAKKSFEALGIPVHLYSQVLTNDDLALADKISRETPMEQMGDFTWEGVAVGEHAMAGAIRFFANADLSDEPNAAPIARRYLKAALLSTFVAKRLFDSYNFKVLVGSHGIYVPQGLFNEVARSKKARVVNWHQAYRQHCLIFSEGDTYHKTLMVEPTSVWDQIDFTDELENEIMSYLESRQYGKRDWISFNPNPDQDTVKALAEMGVNTDRPVIGLLTNVAWDAQLHYGASPFKNMMDWLVQTVAYFEKRPDLQLLVRVHPAEVSGVIPSRQPAVAEIQKAFPKLPPNVFIIPPESKLSTYDAMALCNAVIIYATKTGIELTSRGIPVIVAGEAWIKNKGLAPDVTNTAQYFEVLDRLPLAGRLDRETTRRARMYAYHFFFRRMIPVDFLNDKLAMEISDLRELLPGNSRGLDVICNGILNGTPFVYPAEEVSLVAGTA